MTTIFDEVAELFGKLQQVEKGWHDGIGGHGPSIYAYHDITFVMWLDKHADPRYDCFQIDLGNHNGSHIDGLVYRDPTAYGHPADQVVALVTEEEVRDWLNKLNSRLG